MQHFITATLPDATGLTFGNDGVLYGMSGSNNHLFTINPYTGAWTDLGMLGIFATYLPNCNGDLAFYNNTLYYLGDRLRGVLATRNVYLFVRI